MPGEALVEIRAVRKKYSHSLKSSMRYGVQDIARDLRGREPPSGLRPDEFYALDGVDLTLRRGECLGLVGANGAGKSTLLKMINGIFMPDEGEIIVRGSVGALIEVGAGFHPLLSGRENIYLNGSILGMSKAYIDECFDSIVEFAELEKYIDMPVKSYSSGMYVRLGFAIASKLKADVVLLDEILSVGDVRFQAKCFNAIADLMRDSAVIFVSHSMAQVSRVSTRVGFLSEGSIEQFDDPARGIDRFLQSQQLVRQPLVTGSGRLEITSFAIVDASGSEVSSIAYDQPVEFVFTLDAPEDIGECVAVVSLYSNDTMLVAQCSSRLDGNVLNLRCGRHQIRGRLNKLMLNVGTYSVSVAIMDGDNLEVLTRVDHIVDVTLQGNFFGYAPVQFSADWSVSQ